MKNDPTSSQPDQQANPPAFPNATASASAPNQPPTASARRSQIRQTASASSTPINFARPIFQRQDSDSANTPPQHRRITSADSSHFGHASNAGSEDAAWQDEVPLSPSDRRAANLSTNSDRSGYLTPLKIRRRGLINDKKLTINVASPASSNPSSSRRAVSESDTPSSSSVKRPPRSPARPLPAVTKSSVTSSKPLSISPGGKQVNSSPTDSLAPPPSAGIRWAPFTPTKRGPLADSKRSPTGKSSSPKTASSAGSSDRSDKPLLSAPRYGFNPEFQLGFDAAAGSPSRSQKDVPLPTKPSPTYSGASQGGVKSMLYTNARSYALPMSPKTHIAPKDASLRSNEVPSSARIPPTLHTPRTPRTPRTPLTARLPHTPGLSAQAAGAYRGILLTTVTRAASDERVTTQDLLAHASSKRRTRNRSASIATEIRSFVRGGASEVIPRFELRVLELPRRDSQFHGLDSNQQTQPPPSKRHSLAAARPSTLCEKQDKLRQPEQDEASPRTSAFARSMAMQKLMGKQQTLPPLDRQASPARRGSLYRGLSFVGQTSERCERRLTAGTTASGRSDGTARTSRSGLPRRTSMPVSTAGSISSARPSLKDRSMSMAPQQMWDRLISSMQPDEGEGDNHADIVNEKQSRATDIYEAKRRIMGRRTSDLYSDAPAVVGRDVYSDMPMSAMRRPTYAASVFQQARLMEAERQAGATPDSSSMPNVNSPFPHTPGFPRTPLTAFPHTPRFPKTPLTALPEGIVQGEPIYLEETVAAAAPASSTLGQKTAYWLMAPVRIVKKQISPAYILTMLNPREIIIPITLRKVALWIVYGGIIAALVLLDRYYHWWHKFDHAVHGKNLAIMGVLYGFEPLMILIIMLVARVPDARVVPDRTVLVPNGRNGAESFSDDETRSSLSSDGESVASQDMAAQTHATILEEEHGEDEVQHVEEHDVQHKQTGIVEGDNVRPSYRFSMRQLSTRSMLASSERTGENAERRPSEWSTNSGSHGGLSVPRTPGFDPRNRRSTIILHERPSIDKVNLELERTGSRRPSNPSHQMLLARTASRESRRSSYFGAYAAAAGSRLDGVTAAVTPSAAVEDDVKDEKNDMLRDVTRSTNSSDEVDDEKKKAQVDQSAKPDEVRVDMGSITHPSLTESTALVIPCHNADVEVLKAVLFAALVHFEPWQIFVVDNGNTPEPPAEMEASLRAQPMFARVNYIWLPIGNKNIAQFVGAKAAAVLKLDYVITIDDDAIIPANFAAPMHIISETVTAVCYPITAVDHKGDRPLFVGWQDIEYKLSALAKMAEARMCGVLFPHGAASFWKRDTMIRVLRRHDLVYFADDVKMGLELQALGEKMSIDASISFETVAPETFIGPYTAGTPNYYHQRVRSWEMARHTLYWQFSKRFLFSLNGARGPVAIGWQKFTQFYNSTTNFIDWIRLPMFILLGGSSEFWLRSFAFFLFLPVIPAVLYRFIMVRHRPDLHPHLLDMLTYGIYKLLYSVVCVFGGIRSMLVFFPNHSHRATLEEMEASGDKRCIWMREDFMRNSGGQGDLRDEPQQILLDEAVALEDTMEEEAMATQMEQVRTTMLGFEGREEEASTNAVFVFEAH